jgi:hypothetical protein
MIKTVSLLVVIIYDNISVFTLLLSRTYFYLLRKEKMVIGLHIAELVIVAELSCPTSCGKRKRGLFV